MLRKTKVFLSEYADMCHTHFSRVFRRLNLLPVKIHVSKTFHALDLMMEVAQIRAEDGTFQKCTVNTDELSLQKLKCIYL